MSSASDESVMEKIRATHTPDGHEVDVEPILQTIEDILRRGTPSVDGVLNCTSGQVAACKGKLEGLSYSDKIHKISCQLSCKCSEGGDWQAETMPLFTTLGNYSWETKMVLTLAAFAVNYGEIWLVAQLCTTNSLAKSVAFLKQLPDILENYNSLKPQFDAVNNLIKAILDITKLIVELKQLRSKYNISIDLPATSTGMTHILPDVACWTIRSILACSTQIASLIGLRAEYIASELSSLAEQVSNIHKQLKKQMKLYRQHISEIEAYRKLVRLLETFHKDNMEVLRELICAKDDGQALVHVEGSARNMVHIKELSRKHVLLLISDLDLSHEEIRSLELIYKERTADGDYEIVWLPVVDRSIDSHEGLQNKFKELQKMMPWYSVHQPSLIEHAVIKYIKEAWHFSKKPILVSLDPQGKVLNQNVFNMLSIWQNKAFPCSSETEQTLWNKASWGPKLLLEPIDGTVQQWITEGKHICVYGGEDVNWIEKFTEKANEVSKNADIDLKIVYVGMSNARERMKKIIDTIEQKKLGHFLKDTSLWLFWARLESMLNSKLRHGKALENDHIMQDVMTILGYGSEKGWAIFCQGKSAEMSKAKGDRALKCMSEFENWGGEVHEKGFLGALNDYLKQLHTTHHCYCLMLPEIDGGLPGKAICAECGRPMERFIMYRCCVD